MKKNKCVCLLACLHGVKKTFFMIFSIRAHWSKKHGLGWDQTSKNIVSFRVQRSKKHFRWFSRFMSIGRKNMVLIGIKSQETLFPSGFKGQKNISCKNFKISIFTPKKGPMVDHCVLSGSKEHQLPASRVKKTFFTKTLKSRFSRRRKVQRWTTVSFRGQKNINFRVQRSKKHQLQKSIKPRWVTFNGQKNIDRLKQS